MKNLYFLLLLLFGFSISHAQIITFTDVAFKDKLLQANESNGIATGSDGFYMVVDANADDEIDQTEALAVSELDLYIGSITSLEGIEYFTNLTHLDCGLNQLESLDVSALTNLEELKCVNNNIATLNVTGLASLLLLHNAGNELTTMDLSGLTDLEDLWCEGNLLTALDVTGLDNLVTLSCEGNLITDLSVSLPNLTSLNANENELATLDANGSPSLQTLTAEENLLTAVTFNGLQQLQSLELHNNNLNSISLIDLPNLQTIFLMNNQLTTIDISECTNLNSMSVLNNQLETMFLKNGTNETVVFGFNPTLEYICADDEQLDTLQFEVEFLDYAANVNSYCSFSPGGTFHTLSGNSRTDFGMDGCDVNDSLAPFMEFDITDGTNTGTFFGDNSGNFDLPLPEGQHTITPQIQNPDYFNVTPSSITVDFPTDPDPFLQNFCIEQDGEHPDVDITIMPLVPARPGFPASYKLVYTNKGNQIQSGSLNFTYYNDTVMTFVEATPAADTENANTLIWNYTDLHPFQSRSIMVEFTVNAPTDTPPVEIDDVLTFDAFIDPTTGDETPDDNSFILDQVVVGSFDPNDITCLQGVQVSPEEVGDYVHYRIRFENTGTFPAENVVVVDTINSEMFNLSTLQVVDGSHAFVTQVNDGIVEFIFEGIDLPFTDEENDGYVLFKIRTNSGLGLGDSFSNRASIFFDFNFPIVTNTYVTTIDELVSTTDTELLNEVKIYPNPGSEILHIVVPYGISPNAVTIYNMLGQAVYHNSEEMTVINVSDLRKGVYLVKLSSEKGEKTLRFVKN